MDHVRYNLKTLLTGKVLNSVNLQVRSDKINK